MTALQIAIDGPAGAGKSTTAKETAKRLKYLYIDTGAMYRAVALLAIRQSVAFDDEKALTEIAEKADITLRQEGEKYLVFIDGEDVSEAIRRPEVGNAASPVSANPGVRQVLVEKQQAMAAKGGVVMDGRDIGTVVLPDADCKIFLTASLDVRAQRRVLELQAKGLDVDFEQVKKDVRERDERDSSRAASPLKQADDAVLIDSSDMTFEEVVSRIIRLAEAR